MLPKIPPIYWGLTGGFSQIARSAPAVCPTTLWHPSTKLLGFRDKPLSLRGGDHRALSDRDHSANCGSSCPYCPPCGDLAHIARAGCEQHYAQICSFEECVQKKCQEQLGVARGIQAPTASTPPHDQPKILIVDASGPVFVYGSQQQPRLNPVN